MSQPMLFDLPDEPDAVGCKGKNSVQDEISVTYFLEE